MIIIEFRYFYFYYQSIIYLYFNLFKTILNNIDE